MDVKDRRKLWMAKEPKKFFFDEKQPQNVKSQVCGLWYNSTFASKLNKPSPAEAVGYLGALLTLHLSKKDVEAGRYYGSEAMRDRGGETSPKDVCAGG